MYLRNEGRSRVQLLNIGVPGRAVTRVRTDGGSTLARATIARDDSLVAIVSLTSRACKPVDRVVVRLHVAGRDVTQTVHLQQPASFSC